MRMSPLTNGTDVMLISLAVRNNLPDLLRAMPAKESAEDGKISNETTVGKGLGLLLLLMMCLVLLISPPLLAFRIDNAP